MTIKGGCYCGAVRFEVDADPLLMAQCHCRECQYISGGGPNYTAGVPAAAFRYTQGAPEQFARDDLDEPVVREFCGKCGTSIGSRPPSMADIIMLKVGTFDDPGIFNAGMAIYTVDIQDFHHVPDGIPTFERVPG